MTDARRPWLIGAVMVGLCVAGIGFGWWWGGGAGPAPGAAEAGGDAGPTIDAVDKKVGRSSDAGGAGPGQTLDGVSPQGVLDPDEARLDETDGNMPTEGPGGRPTVYEIDPDGLRESIQSVLPKITECYEAVVTDDPERTGRMSLSLAIGPEEGSVTSRVVELEIDDPDLQDEGLQDCVADAIHALHYQPGSRVEVTWPVTFDVD